MGIPHISPHAVCKAKTGSEDIERPVGILKVFVTHNPAISRCLNGCIDTRDLGNNEVDLNILVWFRFLAALKSGQ